MFLLIILIVSLLVSNTLKLVTQLYHILAHGLIYFMLNSLGITSTNLIDGSQNEIFSHYCKLCLGSLVSNWHVVLSNLEYP